MKRKTLTSEEIDALAKKGIDKQSLTENNVKRIFQNCLAKDQAISFKNGTYDFDKKQFIDNGRISVHLMLDSFGFENEDSPVLFDPEKIEEYRKGIKYMLGQLKVVHDGNNLISFEITEFMKKYGDYGYWTDTITPVAELFYLSDAAGFSTYFEFHKDKKIYTYVDSEIVPTFDPDDKNHAQN